MVFVSLESFLDVAESAMSTRGGARPRCASLLPLVQVVVTPSSISRSTSDLSSDKSQTSPPPKRSRLRRAASTFSRSNSSRPTSSNSATSQSPRAEQQFVLYVSDRTMQHRWVLTRTAHDYQQLKKALVAVTQICDTRVCCQALCDAASIKSPKRRWGAVVSRVVKQVEQSQSMQEDLNRVLAALAFQDGDCQAIDAAWELVDAFLQVADQRAIVAEDLVGDGRKSTTHQHQPHKLCEASHTPISTSSRAMRHVECSICGDSLAHQSTTKLSCCHAFHADCICVWLRMDACCPVCRVPVA